MKISSKVFALVLLCMSMVSVEAVEFNNLSDNAKVALLTVLADDGDAGAQNALGVIYDKGMFGMQRDYKKAFDWYSKADSQGCTKALYNLGCLYRDEKKGVARSDLGAMTDLKAMTDLEKMYIDGKSIEKDVAIAKRLFELAAAKGHPVAFDL